MVSEGRPGVDDLYSLRDGTQKLFSIPSSPPASCSCVVVVGFKMQT